MSGVGLLWQSLVDGCVYRRVILNHTSLVDEVGVFVLEAVITNLSNFRHDLLRFRTQAARAAGA